MARTVKRNSRQPDAKTTDAPATEPAPTETGFVWSGWPAVDFPMPTFADWFRIQQDLFWSAAQFGQELMTTAFTEMNQGSGIMQRLMAVRTPEELAACERDLRELASSKYFEQVMNFVERMRATFEQGTPDGAKAAARIAARKTSA